MLDILVQVLGFVDGAPGSYNWITVAKIDNPESLDIDYLKSEVLKFVRKSENGTTHEVHESLRPHSDVVRLVVRRDQNIEMKILLNEFFRKEVK